MVQLVEQSAPPALHVPTNCWMSALICESVHVPVAGLQLDQARVFVKWSTLGFEP